MVELFLHRLHHLDRIEKAKMTSKMDLLAEEMVGGHLHQHFGASFCSGLVLIA